MRSKATFENEDFKLSFVDKGLKQGLQRGTVYHEVLLSFIKLMEQQGYHNVEFDTMVYNLKNFGMLYPIESDDDDYDNDFDDDDACSGCPDVTCPNSPDYVAKEGETEV